MPLHNFAPTPVSQSPTLNKPRSVPHQVAQPGLLRSLPALALALEAPGTRTNGQVGSLPARPVFLVLPAVGVVPVHGVAQVTGVATAVPVVLAALEVQEVSVHGVPKPAASTAINGPPGLLDGVPSLRGLAPGLAAAQPPPLPSPPPSPPPSPLAARLKSSPVPPSVSKPSLLLPLVALVTVLHPSAALAHAVLWSPPSLPP